MNFWRIDHSHGIWARTKEEAEAKFIRSVNGYALHQYFLSRTVKKVSKPNLWLREIKRQLTGNWNIR